MPPPKETRLNEAAFSIIPPAPTQVATGLTGLVAGATEANIKEDFEKVKYTGNIGATTYTIGDIVKVLKELGLLKE